MTIFEKGLADLAYNGLHSYLKEKLEGFDFLSVNHLQMKGVGLEFKLKNAKDTYKTHRSNTHAVDHDSDCSGGEENEAKLSYLTSVRQGRDEPASDYFRRFKDIKN